MFDVTTGQVLRRPAPQGVSAYNIRVEGGDIEVEI
jgi:nitrite reductase/ring-hydroxylating ferredoxin subunit